MERELFEHIVMSVCKSESKTKQVMDIVYPKLPINYPPFRQCDCGRLYDVKFICCPYCPNTADKLTGYFKKCENKHYYRKELNYCPYCEPILEPIIESVPEPKEISKKQELIDSLDYLKKKEHKTDKDKESISVIQAILNGMK